MKLLLLAHYTKISTLLKYRSNENELFLLEPLFLCVVYIVLTNVQ